MALEMQEGPAIINKVQEPISPNEQVLLVPEGNALAADDGLTPAALQDESANKAAAAAAGAAAGGGRRSGAFKKLEGFGKNLKKLDGIMARKGSRARPKDAADGAAAAASATVAADVERPSGAETPGGTVPVRRDDVVAGLSMVTEPKVVLKYTTVAEGTNQPSFIVTAAGASIGQGPDNTLSIPTDTALALRHHAFIEYCAEGEGGGEWGASDGNGEGNGGSEQAAAAGGTPGRAGAGGAHGPSRFYLVDGGSGTDFAAAIRLRSGVGHREWPMGEGCCFSVGNSVFKCSRFPPPGSPESGRLSTGGGAAEAPVRGSPPHPHHHHGRHQSAPASFAADSTGRVGTAGSQAIAAEALVEEAAAAAADGEEGDDGAAAGGGNDDGGAGAADAGADDAAAAAAAAADAAPPAAAAVGSIPEDAAVEEPVQEAEPAPAEKRQPPLGRVPGKMWIHAKTGPLKGQTLTVTEAGAALGRATDNDASIADKELSRRHSRIEYESDLDEFFLCDVGSLNGTYMQLVGPYANKYRLGLSDHFLVGRTGFSVNRFDYGVSERMGSRPSMEDKSTIIQDMAVAGLTGTHLWPQTFVGVFDGHGGAQASEYLWDNLHLRLADSLQARAGELSAAAAEIDSSMSTGEVGGDDVEGSFALLDGLVKQAFMEAFKATDDAFIKDSEHPQAGSTATTALILGGRVYVANVGDSRTIITREGRVLAASEDHKPQREDEEERIRNAGGFIVHKRVMGNLAVSRAFGDAEFKRGIGAHGPDADGLDSTSGGCAPLVISEPEFTVVQLTPAEDFMVLACDGLFDVFSNVEVVQAVCAEMAVHGDAQKCCESITLRAIRERHTRDNVTMILVMLRSTALSAADGEGDAASLPASPARTAAAAAAAAATAAAAVTASAAPSAAAAGGEVREEPDAKATA